MPFIPGANQAGQQTNSRDGMCGHPYDIAQKLSLRPPQKRRFHQVYSLQDGALEAHLPLPLRWHPS